MFRDAMQAARAARGLLVRVRLADLWTEAGPTERARALRRAPRGLTPAERVMVRAAWSVWTLHTREPGRGASLHEVMRDASPADRLMLGQLIVAATYPGDSERWTAIDGWIDRTAERQRGAS